MVQWYNIGEYLQGEIIFRTNSVEVWTSPKTQQQRCVNDVLVCLACLVRMFRMFDMFSMFSMSKVSYVSVSLVSCHFLIRHQKQH